MCAWEPVPQFRRKWAASAPIWPTVGKQSSDAVAPSFRLSPQNALSPSKTILTTQQMYISPWLRFSHGHLGVGRGRVCDFLIAESVAPIFEQAFAN